MEAGVSAPRVPPGWTQAAADLVWEDWQAALGLDDGGISSRHTRAWPSMSMYGTLLSVPGYEITDPKQDRQGRVLMGWVTQAARLRAWAAVGAPVLPPADDGRPSLAEWVAALPSSATWEGAYRKGDWSLPPSPAGCAITFVWARIASIEIHSDDATGAITAKVHANYKQTWYATPGALRAALDALAAGAK